MTVANTLEPRTSVAALRRSPLQHRHRELAESTVEGLRGVRLGEEPFLTQVNLRAPAEEPGEVARIGKVLGTALPRQPNRVAAAADDAVLRLGPDEWLVVAPDGQADRVIGALLQAPVGARGSVVDVSANRTTVSLAGPAAREVLESVCALDLHPRVFGRGHCARTLVGKTQAVLWQVGEEPAYRMLVRCSFAEYLADLLLDAMRPLTGGARR